MNTDEKLIRTLRTVTLDAPPDAPPGLFDRLSFAAEMIAAAPPEPAGARLIWRERDGSVRVAAVGDAGLVVGRDSDAGLALADPKLSRRHFHLRREGHEFLIEDLKSRNGIWVNRKRVASRILCDGDVIEAGALALVFARGGRP